MAKFEVTVQYSYRAEDEKTITVTADSYNDFGEDEIRDALAEAGHEFAEELRIDNWDEED